VWRRVFSSPLKRLGRSITLYSRDVTLFIAVSPPVGGDSQL
jgi:hypothetical protein